MDLNSLKISRQVKSSVYLYEGQIVFSISRLTNFVQFDALIPSRVRALLNFSVIYLRNVSLLLYTADNTVAQLFYFIKKKWEKLCEVVKKGIRP